MFVAFFVAALLQPEPIVPGLVERDLTGDGKPEILRVMGVGPTDNLALTFTIEAAGRTVYRFELAPLTRTVGSEAGRHELSLEEQRTRIEAFGRWFFAEDKFRRPDDFVTWLRAAAPGRVADVPAVIARDRQASESVAGSVIWEEMQHAPVTIFTFSPGGDALVAIGWGDRAGRFYRLLDCC